MEPLDLFHCTVEKKKKTTTKVKEGKSEDKPTDSKVLEEVHCSRIPDTQSCTIVRRGECNIPRLSHTRGEIKFESEMQKNNYSKGSTQTNMNGS